MAAQNEPYNQSSESEVIRLRINMQAQVTSLPTNGQAFKLQYSATTTGGWTDLGDIGSSSAWRGYDNVNSSVDGDRAVGTQLDSNVRESYEEENPTVTNPASISASNKGEWDWVIQNFSALPASSFYFRMVRADGTPLDSYENYPAVTTTQPVIAFDNFESGGFSGGTGWQAGWTTSGDANTAVTTNDSPIEGLRHVRLRSSIGYAARPVDLSGEGQVILQFWAKARTWNPGDELTLSVSDDGVSFTTIHTWVDGDDDNVYKFYQFDLGTYAPTFTSNYWIEFDANMNNTSDRFYVDDLKLIGE